MHQRGTVKAHARMNMPAPGATRVSASTPLHVARHDP